MAGRLVSLVIVAALAVAAAVVAVAVGQRSAPVRGTSGDDRLIGTPGPDDIRGLAGADLLLGRGGPDFLMGNSGADDLRGAAGADTLLAGPGADRLAGGPGDDVLQAGTDRDRDLLACGPGEDTAIGAAPDVIGPDCEFLRIALPQGSAPTPVTVEFLGWASLPRPRDPGVVVSVPPGAVPSGGTLTACSASDRRLAGYFRMHGIAGPTATRTVLVLPTGPAFVDLNSVRRRDEGRLLLYNFVRGTRGPAGELANGAYTIRFQVAAAGAYTTVAEATVTRACP